MIKIGMQKGAKENTGQAPEMSREDTQQQQAFAQEFVDDKNQPGNGKNDT